MMKALLPAVVLLLSFSSRGFAADQGNEVDGKTTTMKLEDAKPATETNKPGNGPDVDEIITNKKMRAESGSKSKWSVGTSWSYSGGTVETPLSAQRPNITGGNAATTVSALGGSVGVGYKITTTDRLSLDLGVRWITPLQKDAPNTYGGKRMDASNPSLTYSKAYKMGAIQSIFQAGPTLYTFTNLRQQGYQYAFDIAQNNAYEFGHSGFSLGLYVAAEVNTFDKNTDTQGNSLKEAQSDYILAASPFMEYVINDTFNLRTVFNWASYEHVRSETNRYTFIKDVVQQSVGLGISVTRDIFLYPNIQFLPRDIGHVFKASETNVALNANINIF
jgi:hypothetical protein